MEPNVFVINNDYKEKQRLKNVKEYQEKFFKRIMKRTNKVRRWLDEWSR